MFMFQNNYTNALWKNKEVMYIDLSAKFEFTKRWLLGSSEALQRPPAESALFYFIFSPAVQLGSIWREFCYQNEQLWCKHFDVKSP